MIGKSWFSGWWQGKSKSCVALAGTLLIAGSQGVVAQVIPDNTLGAESSVVTPNLNIRGIDSDRIDGGATRGANLFHSFGDFSVGEGRGAYFANPTGIESIITRVTGNNASNIMGRLGVLGGANLFLLNPNGIIFGPNASLDIQGSFLATTAERIQLGDTGYFSAAQPQTSSLLSVSPGALLFSQAASQPTAIINQGNLSTGKNLTLLAGNLDLQGQLQAGGNLTLQAQDTVKVRDSAAIPFIASSGGNLVVQGDRTVDIFALSHLESGFFSGNDIVLRSNNTVGGDAHYWSRGSFRIEQLNGSLGNLFSPHDPIIRARGNVTLNTYQGASLHILAGGKVEISGYVWIQGADPENGLVENVNLADGTTVSIDGKSEPTLDIRAGVNPDVIGEQILTVAGTGSSDLIISATSIPSSADILIGTVLFTLPDDTSVPLAGRVLLTNQYQPNSSLSGDIQVTDTQQGQWGAISVAGGVASPSVAINSRGSITLDGTVDASSISGDGGNIALFAKNDITTGELNSRSRSSENAGNGGAVSLRADGSINTDFISSESYSELGNAGNGGAVNLSSTNGSIATSSILSSASSDANSAGDGGAISLNAPNGNIATLDLNSSTSSSSSGNAGAGGNISLEATGGEIYTMYLDSDSSSVSGNAGNGGAIHLKATGEIFNNDVNSSSVSSSGDTGNGGAIRIESTNGRLLTSNLYSSSYSRSGNAGAGGDINLETTNTIDLIEQVFSTLNTRTTSDSSINSTGSLGSGNIAITSQSPFVYDNGIITSDTFGSGKGGDILISAPTITLSGGAQLSASTHSSGLGGNITLRASDKVELSGTTTKVSLGIFSSRTGFSAIPPGTYLGGYIPNGDINSFPPQGTLFPSGVFAQTTIGSTGSAGNLRIETGQLTIKNGATIATTTFGNNSNAGNISVQAQDSISVANGSVLSGVAEGAIGNSGNVDLSTRSLAIIGGGTVQTQTLGQGIAGNIQVNATDTITISGIDPTSLTVSGLRSGSGGSNTQLGTASNNIGRGGDINVTTGNLRVADGGVLDAQTVTNSRGGNIIVNATQSLDINQASLLAQSNGAAPAGNVTINTRDLTARSGTITTSSRQSAGGEIAITADKIRLLGNSDITTNVNSGAGGGGDITLTADSILAFDDSDILAFAQNEGGDITLTTSAFFGENYRPAPRNTNPDLLNDNNQVDINATGAVSGIITIPDLSFIQNSLIELPENQINTDRLLANSCIVRREQRTSGSFTITGTGGLPQRPGDAQISSFPTVDVETLPSDSTPSNINPNRAWQKGDPIVEPQGAYRLPNGKLVLSRECS